MTNHAILNILWGCPVANSMHQQAERYPSGQRTGLSSRSRFQFPVRAKTLSRHPQQFWIPTLNKGGPPMELPSLWSTRVPAPLLTPAGAPAGYLQGTCTTPVMKIQRRGMHPQTVSVRNFLIRLGLMIGR